MRQDDKTRRPQKLGDVLSSVLQTAGLSDRVAQAGVIAEWPRIVGPQISTIAEPIMLQQDGTLVVAVKTHGWMTELSLLEPELLRQLNADTSRPPVTGLRWTLRR
jgi:predicted nucleic acid-binding Zn ribbon protein